MKTINRRTFYQSRMKADGSEYTLYTYEVVDDLGNKEKIDSLREYEKGDRVETWFDAKYNKPKMRPYQEKRPICDRCKRHIKEEIEHEFCAYSHTSRQ